MKIVIPYREFSERCDCKNTREFFNGKSLLEISIDQLRGHDIFLACVPSETAIERANKLRVNRLDLHERTLAGSSAELVMNIASNFQPEEQIVFVYCTNPVYYLFNNIAETILYGSSVVENGAGSAIVVYPIKHYILDQNMQGVNHGHGHWHVYSQNLPQWYINPWVFMITSVRDIMKYSYWHTPDVVPIPAKGLCVDIDTEEDFQLAQNIYSMWGK